MGMHSLQNAAESVSVINTKATKLYACTEQTVVTLDEI